jgi:XTP/dITP diphosphohydrolase
MKRVVLASNNAGKLRELKALLEPLRVEVITQSDLNVPDVPETGTTFVENAIIKARNASQHTGLPAIADDSGIEVDALNGEPGVYSARFSGANATDATNNVLLLERLDGVPDEERTARYRAVIVYMRHAADPFPLICTGTWEGRIATEPRGEQGFGYDPYFYVPTHGCHSAELAPEEKNRVSHRGQALRELVEALRAQVPVVGDRVSAKD